MTDPASKGGTRYVMPVEQIPADDPLPRRRLLATPLLDASIKDRPEDFLVDELPLYEPSGSGEHLYLGVQKQGMPHSEMIEVLARHFRVPPSAIGFAGMKDRVAITRQAVSIHLPGKSAPAVRLEHPRMTLLWEARHQNKLRRGHCAGNRFSIRVRRVDPTKAPLVWRALNELVRDGIPDYYGRQRFGYRRNTHRLGRHLINRDDEALLRELLGTASPYPEHQHEQRRLFDEARFADSLPQWGRHDRAERVALMALARGKSPRQAVSAIDGSMRLFWISAYQSAVFNRVLDLRLESGTFARVVEGDVAYKHATRGQFRVSADMLADDELARRASQFEISASGPMFGHGMIEAGPPIAEIEQAATEELGVPAARLLDPSTAIEGTRRPFRVAVRNPELEGGFDEHGPYIRLAFDLPRGAYATVLLQEIFAEGGGGDEDDERAATT
ncbi:MAG: tRNA pseudouridine(13) synthase TruD [Phycisphaerales bacterium]